MLTLGCASLWAQAGAGFDTTTPEGRMLQQINTEEDLQQKVTLLEQFLKEHPDHAAASWVLTQLPPAYAELKQPDQSLTWCEQLLEKNPTNASSAHACLKTAEAQQDPELLRHWALLTHETAAKAVAAPKPEFDTVQEEEEWNASVDYSRQVGEYSAWALYNAALRATGADQKAMFLTALEEAEPKHEQIPLLKSQLLVAYQQAGQMDKATALAEEAIASGTADEDMLLVVANHYLTQQDAAKTIEYANKLVEYLEAKETPEATDAAVWETKKKTTLGTAYWMIGVTHAGQGQYAQADKTLRKALPLIGDNAQLLPGALFYLGLANYQMGSGSGNESQLLAAREFFQRCSAMSSSFKAQAQKNLEAIEGQYHFKQPK
jgi:tetratricopeptide (TPR) repeat protein